MEISSNINASIINPNISQDPIFPEKSATSTGNAQIKQHPGTQKTFSQQFKEVAQNSEENNQQQTVETEISVQQHDSKNLTAQSFNQLQKIKDINILKDSPLPELPESFAEYLTPNNNLKKLQRQSDDMKKELEQKLLGEKGDPVLKSMITGANTQLFARWLKKVILQQKDAEELETEETEKREETQAASKTKAGDTKPQGNISKQQFLFSLNLRSSIKFLKNLKSFNKRFLPEMVIYDEESGFVNSTKTLECLGWQDIATMTNTFYNQLSLENIKKIMQVQQIIEEASSEGLDLFKAKHPVLNDMLNYIAVEKLTGELTVLNTLEELAKLKLDDNVLSVKQVAE
ncbi:MAG: hypothetical protein PHV30_05910 [Candidatus Margulisbacteria bacterium]|nr:hypothetical protein [Candidatus Margulisiibacteriota bacterium]